MERKVNADEYGICIWSMGNFTGFLKREKIKSKKLLALFQKDKKTFLKLVKEGVWIPLPQLDSDDYCIKVKNLGEEYDDQWEQVLAYDGFNLEIADGMWVSGLGSFLKFDEAEYPEEGHEYEGPFGIKCYDSREERWNISLNGYKSFSDIRVDIPAGKYLLAIKGFARKEMIDRRLDKEAVNYGYQLDLVKVSEFNGFKNPREDEYNFNIGGIVRKLRR